MIITTSPGIPGDLHQVKKIVGPVSAEVVLGIHIGKDFMAGFRNLVGGRSEAYEEELRVAQRNALEELESRAAAMGANAVIAVVYDYTTFGADNGMIAVVVNGTAVVVE